MIYGHRYAIIYPEKDRKKRERQIKRESGVRWVLKMSGCQIIIDPRMISFLFNFRIIFFGQFLNLSFFFIQFLILSIIIEKVNCLNDCMLCYNIFPSSRCMFGNSLTQCIIAFQTQFEKITPLLLFHLLTLERVLK